ncbi:hypothetical protein XENTR_v10008598 [Xenopus tropicalis]|nr:hypothetical protein XENTR_v10008598 [Xenopus tropicalis]
MKKLSKLPVRHNTAFICSCGEKVVIFGSDMFYSS